MHSFASYAPRVICIAALLLLGAVQASAEESPSDSSLRVASGPADKVYAKMVKDMQSVCGAAVAVRPVESTGGLQNLSLLSENRADLGIVQIDTLREMSAGDENIQTLQAVMPLHVNLLHVIALASGSLVDVKTVAGAVVPFTGRKVVIHKFSELKGMTVAAVGSAQLMGQTLEKQLRYGMNFVVADDDEALRLLRAGKVQAVFTLGGWPLPAVSRHGLDSGLQLVDFDLAPQKPYVPVKKNYANLGAYNLNFLGVPNLLVTRPFKPGGAMANRVSALGACLRQHLDELQEGQFRPGWKEIKDTDEVYGVRRFAIAPSVPSPGFARDKRSEMSSSSSTRRQ
jgi:TRAP-type uncharacterized transport system substrate-binding protein